MLVRFDELMSIPTIDRVVLEPNEADDNDRHGGHGFGSILMKNDETDETY